MKPVKKNQKRPRPQRVVNRWGRVRQFDIPKWLTRNDLLSHPSSKRILTVLYYLQNEQPKLNRPGKPAMVSVSIDRLHEMTGLCRATVSKAIQLLGRHGLIRQYLTVRNKGASAGFAPAVYTLSSPSQLGLFAPAVLTVSKDHRLLHGNGVAYTTVPRLVLSGTTDKYSLAKMKDPEQDVYLAVLGTATTTNAFSMPTSDLLTLTGRTIETIERALHMLRFRGLVNGRVISRPSGETPGETKIELLDPRTGEPIPPPVDDPEPGPTRAYNPYPDIEGTGYSAADVERLTLECLPPGRYPVSPAGEMLIPCVVHNDRRRKNMNVNVYKGGVYLCRKCKATGYFGDLLATLRRVPVEQIKAELRTLERVRLDEQVYPKPIKPTKRGRAIKTDNPDKAERADSPKRNLADIDAVIDSTRSSLLLNEALAHHRRGEKVTPFHHIVGTGCSCGEPTCGTVAGKHPRFRGWNKDVSSPAKIRRWWKRYPNANIAILTGAVSNLVVIDLDNKDGKNGSANFAALVPAHGELPKTLTARSGTGSHLYFRHPGPDFHIGSNSDILAIGVDVRADGGLVVAPPSMHRNGKLYTWENELEPAQLPAWLLAMLLAMKCK